jgi:deoxyribodipyrimidine photolyase-related protein
MKAGLIFPHQLFEENPLLLDCDVFYLVEEHLYFRQYPFHKRKIAFHRSSMKQYEAWLLLNGKQVQYISSTEEISDIRLLIPQIKTLGISHISYVDTTDFLLERRISNGCINEGIETTKLVSPMFLNDMQDLASKYAAKKKLFQADFYKQQRIQRGVLVEANQLPIGGKWSFDEENRSKFPKKGIVPDLNSPSLNEHDLEAISYTEANFSSNPGKSEGRIHYPTTFEGAKDLSLIHI